MKDKPARALAIIALVFMGIFLAALVATIVDHTLLNGSIGFVALGSAVMTLMIYIALKADGRGFSMTKINNEIEMQKAEKAAEEQEKAEKQQPEQVPDTDTATDAEAAEEKADTDTAAVDEKSDV